MPIGLQPLSAGKTNSSGNSLRTTASPLVSLSVSALRNRRGLFALRARMGNPGPVAAALIGAFDADAVPVEPERHGAAMNRSGRRPASSIGSETRPAPD